MAPKYQFTLAIVMILTARLMELAVCQMEDTNLPVLSRKLRYALFPESSTMGLYLAVAIPLDSASYDVSLSWNIEANYQLPGNYTELVLPFLEAGAARTERQINRRHVYQAVEERIRSYGLQGRECLLRTICEAAESTLRHNGLLGDLLHIIFTLVTVSLRLARMDEATVLSRKLRYIIFPDNSNMGLVLAATIPIEVEGDVSMAWFLEADYHVPENSSDFMFQLDGEERATRTSRSLDRTGVYDILESTFHRFGFHGRECLLRTICEAAEVPFLQSTRNGLLGDLLHIVFTLVLITTIEFLRSACLPLEDVELPRKVRHIVYPEGSKTGLYLSATVPLGKKTGVSVLWYVEANYHVEEYPANVTSPGSKGRTSGDVSRRTTYAMIEDSFRRFGFRGRECLLKTICEAANSPFNQNNQNGLLGELLHLVLTPSTSLNEQLHPAFDIAEERGRNGRDCQLFYPSCHLGLLDVFTILQD